MKGKAIVIILLLMFTCVNVFAAENDAELGEKLSAMRGGLDENVENIFERDLDLPTPLRFLARIFLGIKSGEKFSIESFLLLAAIWFFLFTIIHASLEFLPIFEGKMKYIVSAVVVALIAVTGAINKLSIYYLEFLNKLKWLESLGPLKIFLGLVAIMGITYGLDRVLDIPRKGRILEEADVTGENIAAASSVGKDSKKSIDELSK